MLSKRTLDDVVTVTSIDRLAHSTFDLFATVVDAKSKFCSLAEPWADTGTNTAD